MKTNSLTLAAAIVIVGAGSFVAGRMSGSRVERADPEAEAAAALATKTRRAADDGASGSLATRARGREDGTDARAAGSGAPDPDRLLEMKMALDQSDPVDRSRSWLSFLDGLSVDQFAGVVAAFRDGGVPQDRMGEYAMLLSAWAKLDPLGALEYASANTGGPFARQTILATWAGSDPESALAWAKANHEGDGANPWVVGVIRGLARIDPDRATALMTDMPYSRERGDALGAILPTILDMGPQAARDWVSAIEDERLRDGAMRQVADRLASVDPEGTASWLAANPGETANRRIDDVLSTWTQSDESAAMAYYRNLPAGDIRTNALRGIVSAIASEDPRRAASLIDNNAGDTNDRVVQQFVWHSFREEPKLAADYIGRIDNQRERDEMYRRMLDGWLRRDEASALNWMANNQLPQPVVEHLERRLNERSQPRQ